MTPTREQVLSALEKACDFDVCTMGSTVQLDEQQLMRFASEMAAAGQQAEREKLEPISVTVDGREIPLKDQIFYRTREEQ